MPDIENNFKTETILDMQTSQAILDFVKSLNTTKLIELILIDRLEEARKKGGNSKAEFLIKQYKGWLKL